MRHRIPVSLGAAAICFLMVTNPVMADAARQIAGADIKDTSVTSADIKNRSLPLKDFGPGRARTGHDRPHGSER